MRTAKKLFMSKNKRSSKSSGNNFSLTPGVTKTEKSKRAKYLIRRINDLYDNISEWIKDLNDYSMKKTNISVDGEKLPVVDINYEKKLVVSLKPTGLWAFGVNCRIDIISEKETNILIDITKEKDEPDWQLISSEAGKKPKKLTKVIFRNLLRKLQKLEQM